MKAPFPREGIFAALAIPANARGRVPELMVEQFNVFHLGRPGSLEPTASHLREVGTTISRLTFPYNMAAGLEARGLEPGRPEAVVSDGSVKIYGEIVVGLRARFAEWRPSPAD
jgi:hypothetical protein